MARHDASTLELLVFTFKDGLLAAVAHDLKLHATVLTLEVSETGAHLEVDATSLRVVTPMRAGKEDAGLLPRPLYAEIEKNTVNDVLEAKRHPAITFTTTRVTAGEVVGELTLHGVKREVRGARTGDTVEFTLDQRDFGIKPYSAMLGTLKVKPEVLVRARLTSA